ncbi:protein GPR15L-like [Empidonax traillii]|uniref:protein GPR15L-like n=1 Tax=Empidonax traillii TaxID=164674 RepID=UPI000FFD87F8|nr:protein GPR15L-like [Empidonax traillii]
MKLLALCGFLFVCLLCLSAFAAEGQKARKVCCSIVPKRNKKAHKGVSFKMTPKNIKKYCRPCPEVLVAPGPLPQLK